MPFQSKRGDGGAIPVAPAESVLSDAAATDTRGAAVVHADTAGGPIALTPEQFLARATAADVDALSDAFDRALAPANSAAKGELALAMGFAGFSDAQIIEANTVFALKLTQAVDAAKSGADGAVTLRFVAGRDGSRRVRIGVTVGGRPTAEPAEFEAAKAEG